MGGTLGKTFALFAKSLRPLRLINLYLWHVAKRNLSLRCIPLGEGGAKEFARLGKGVRGRQHPDLKVGEIHPSAPSPFHKRARLSEVLASLTPLYLRGCL